MDRRKPYERPGISKVSLIADESLLLSCKVPRRVINGPFTGFCSGYFGVSCRNAGS